jgi:YtkA-like
MPPAYRVTLAAMGFGLTTALGLLFLGFVSLSGEQPQDEARRGVAAGGTASSPVSVDIEAHHLGELELGIRAAVGLNETKEPLTEADVVAYTDMTEMPLAHTEGPLRMTAVPGEPGIYETRTQVPMVGHFEVRVVVRSPVKGEAKKVVRVGAVGQTGG